MKRITILMLMICLVLNVPVLAGLGSKKAAYLGGTTKEKDFPGLREAVEGTLMTDDEKELKFECRYNNTNKVYSVAYDKITGIEYGQKAGRRVGAAVATGLLVSPVGLALLFSKKRKHFVTIGYKDAVGNEQAAVFEIGKDSVRTTLAVLEARSSKKVEYQDKEAEKAGRGN